MRNALRCWSATLPAAGRETSIEMEVKTSGEGRQGAKSASCRLDRTDGASRTVEKGTPVGSEIGWADVDLAVVHRVVV